jgi:hypothetical protein
MKQILLMIGLVALVGCGKKVEEKTKAEIRIKELRAEAEPAAGIQGRASKTPEELARSAFKAVVENDREAYQRLTMGGISTNEMVNFLELIKPVNSGLQGENIAEIAPGEVQRGKKLFHEGWTSFQDQLKKLGIDLKQAELVRLDIKKSTLPPKKNIPFPMAGITVVFAINKKGYGLQVGGCYRVPGLGWLAQTAPHLDETPRALYTYDPVSDEEAITGADKLARVFVKALAGKNHEMLLQQNPNSLPDEDYKQWAKAIWFANLERMKKEVSDMLKVFEDPDHEMKAFLVKLQTDPNKVFDDDLKQNLGMRKFSRTGPRMEMAKKEFISERNKLAVAESDWGKVDVSKVEIVWFRQRDVMEEIPFPNRQVEVTLKVDGREVVNTIRMEIVKLPKHGWKYTYLEIHQKPRAPKKPADDGTDRPR